MKEKLIRVLVLAILMFLVFFGIGFYRGYQERTECHRAMRVLSEIAARTGER
jgi:hypothetical protein